MFLEPSLFLELAAVKVNTFEHTGCVEQELGLLHRSQPVGP